MTNYVHCVDGELVPMTPDEITAFLAQVNPPGPPLAISFEAFMGLFTTAEQTAILDSSDLGVRLWLLKGTSAPAITLSSPEVSQGLDYLISKALLTTDRKAQVLANTPQGT